jgi:hypothetical protein
LYILYILYKMSEADLAGISEAAEGEQVMNGVDETNKLLEELDQLVEEEKTADSTERQQIEAERQQVETQAGISAMNTFGELVGQSFEGVDKEAVQQAFTDANNALKNVPRTNLIDAMASHGELIIETAQKLYTDLRNAGYTEQHAQLVHKAFAYRVLDVLEGISPEGQQIANDVRTQFDNLQEQNANLTNSLEESRALIKSLNDKVSGVEKQLSDLLETPEGKRFVEKGAAESKTSESKWKRGFKTLVITLSILGAIGGILFFMFQYAADHTGCFVFSDTVSAKLACNDGVGVIHQILNVMQQLIQIKRPVTSQVHTLEHNPHLYVKLAM